MGHVNAEACYGDFGTKVNSKVTFLLVFQK